MIGSFDTPGWSDPHHGGASYHKGHKTWLFLFYGGHTFHEGTYVSGGHGDTVHD